MENIEVDGSIVLTVSEDRLEKDQNIKIEYTAEISCLVPEERKEPIEKDELINDFFKAVEEVFGKAGENKYTPKAIMVPSLSKEIAIADKMNIKWMNEKGIEIFSVYFLKYQICEEDREKIKAALQPRPEEFLFR